MSAKFIPAIREFIDLTQPPHLLGIGNAEYKVETRRVIEVSTSTYFQIHSPPALRNYRLHLFAHRDRRPALHHVLHKEPETLGIVVSAQVLLPRIRRSMSSMPSSLLFAVGPFLDFFGPLYLSNDFTFVEA